MISSYAAESDNDNNVQGSDYLGSNSRCRANRSRAIGWKPVKTKEDMLASIITEVEVTVKKPVTVRHQGDWEWKLLRRFLYTERNIKVHCKIVGEDFTKWSIEYVLHWPRSKSEYKGAAVGVTCVFAHICKGAMSTVDRSWQCYYWYCNNWAYPNGYVYRLDSLLHGK